MKMRNGRGSCLEDDIAEQSIVAALGCVYSADLQISDASGNVFDDSIFAGCRVDLQSLHDNLLDAFGKLPEAPR